MEEHPYPSGGSVLLLDVLAQVPEALVPVILARAAAAAGRLIVCDVAGLASHQGALAAAGWRLEAQEMAGAREIRMFGRG